MARKWKVTGILSVQSALLPGKPDLLSNLFGFDRVQVAVYGLGIEACDRNAGQTLHVGTLLALSLSEFALFPEYSRGISPSFEENVHSLTSSNLPLFLKQLQVLILKRITHAKERFLFKP